MSNAFGDYLKELRGNRSLREVSNISGISHTYIRNLELGKKTDPSKDTLRKLANSYGVSYIDLLNRVYSLDVSSDDEAAEDMRNFLRPLLEDVKKKLTKNGEFLNNINHELEQLEEKYEADLEENEKITLEWIERQINDMRYDDEWILDLLKELIIIAEIYSRGPDIESFINKRDVTYKGKLLTEKDKQLLISYLDALTAN